MKSETFVQDETAGPDFQTFAPTSAAGPSIEKSENNDLVAHKRPRLGSSDADLDEVVNF